MRLIFLNIWGGKVFEPLIKFFKREAAVIDIFCLQEVIFGETPEFSPVEKARLNIFSELAVILKNFVAYKYLAPVGSYFSGEELPGGIRAGQVIFIRQGLEVVSEGGFRTYAEDKHINSGIKITGSLQHLKFKKDGEIFVVGNLHGLWQQLTHKVDTPERLEQSRRVKDFFDGEKGKKILGGDFNLRPDTQSIKIIGDGMKDLIEEYGITSTRSSFYTKEVKFSDYIFVSSDVRVKDFKVLDDVVSDHLPLVLEF